MRRFASYQLKRGDNLASSKYWGRILEDLDLRLDARENDALAISAATNNLIAVGLQRLNDVFTPLIEEARDNLASYGVSFTGESLSELTVGTGQKTAILTAETRGAYYPPAYVVLSADSGAKVMTAQVLTYVRETGALNVDVLQVVGTGTAASWSILMGSMPDLTHNARIDNPHSVTAAQVGTMTTAAIGTAIAEAIAGVNMSTLLRKDQNLADLADKSAACDTLGLKSAAFHLHTEYLLAGALTGYATQSWVSASYATSAALTSGLAGKEAAGVAASGDTAVVAWATGGFATCAKAVRWTSAGDIAASWEGDGSYHTPYAGGAVVGQATVNFQDYNGNGQTAIGGLRYKYLQATWDGVNYYTVATD